MARAISKIHASARRVSRLAVGLLVLMTFLGLPAAAADTAQLGSGTATVDQTDNIGGGSEQEIIDALKQGLKDAGPPDATIGTSRKAKR